MPYNTLKQSALYFDQFVIYDPLFKYTDSRSEATNAMSSYLGFGQSGIDRKAISNVVKLLKSITPMIAADFVKILPFSKIFEAPKEIPIYMPVNHYADDLPKEIMDYCREKAVIRSMKKIEGGWEILDEPDLTPGIFIEFEGLESRQGQMYNYFIQEFIKTEDPKKFQTKMWLAEYPMDKKTWDIWAFQSVNKSSISIVDKIYKENLIANDLKATYLTNSEFTANLLTKTLSAKETVETSSASQFMNLELPFLDKVDIGALMDIRTYDSEIFTNFRLELERQFRELRTITDEKEIKLRQENIIHELGSVQVKKISQKLDSFKRKGLADAIILMGGLAGTVQTGGWSLLASALASVSGYKNYREYKDSLSENPSYLLWKIIKKW